MPYKNEHSCRKKAPGGYKRFRRENNWRKHDGKRIDAIWGIKDDEEETTELQAMRMPTSDWTEKSARAYCKAQGGIRFEPAVKEKENKMAEDTYRCECLDCNHKFDSKVHCNEAKCPKCAGTNCRRADRPGPGQRAYSPGQSRVPAMACRLTAGIFELGDNGADAKTAPVRILARTPSPVDHWFWGRTVHDLEGAKFHKERLPIDYVHDDDQVLGYLNHHEITERGLEVTGALTPFGAEDRAAEVIYKSKAGVPYEASIYFGGKGLVIEEISADATVEVNGDEFTGPGIVFRQWPLRGVAICPYGADMNAVTEFGEGESIAIQTLEAEDHAMSEVTEEAVVEPDEDVEAIEEVEMPAEAVEEAAVDAEEDTVEEPTETDGPVQEFVSEFGVELGYRWWSEGRTIEEARQLQLDLVKAERDALKLRVEQAGVELGATESVEASADDEPVNQRYEELKDKMPDGQAKFAADMKFADDPD